MGVPEESLNSLDSAFLELEQADEGALMHTGGALVFDARAQDRGAPSRDELLALLEERFGMLPRFGARLSKPRVEGLRRPTWVSDPTFDLSAHVRQAALPAPGGDAELHEWLGNFWSHRLDRARPLWEMTLVDGLKGGGWMLATKTHHAMIDGVGAMDIGSILLDTEPQPGPRTARPASEPDDGADHSHLPGLLSPAMAAAHVAIDTVRHPTRLVRAGEAAVAMGSVIWQDEVHATRRSSLNVPIGTTRRFASVSVDLAAAKTIKRALGGTVNDVVLAVATGALRRLLAERGETLDRPLRAMVPVNIRGDDHTSLGNQVSSLFVDLPIGVPDVRGRYERTRAVTDALKSGTTALGTATVFAVTGPLPPVLHERIAQMFFDSGLFNITITNIPGPQFPLYALGSRLRKLLPLVPLAADHTLALAILSYDGTLFFGINADRAGMPDLEVVQTALTDEFLALLSLARA